MCFALFPAVFGLGWAGAAQGAAGAGRRDGGLPKSLISSGNGVKALAEGSDSRNWPTLVLWSPAGDSQSPVTRPPLHEPGAVNSSHVRSAKTRRERERGGIKKKKKEREKTDFASDKILQLKLFLPARFSGRSAASRQVLGGDFGSGNGAFCTSQDGKGLLPSALSHPQVGAAGCCPSHPGARACPRACG